MEMKKDLHSALFSTTLLKVLDFLLQHPDAELNDTEISAEVRTAKKSAVNVALRRLAELGLVTRTPRGKMNFNRLTDNAVTEELRITSNLIALSALVERLKPVSDRIVLFGSRADGTHTSESDFDLLIVASDEKAVLKAIKKDVRAEAIQPLIKAPDEMLSFDADEPALSLEVKKGKVLWERK